MINTGVLLSHIVLVWAYLSLRSSQKKEQARYLYSLFKDHEQFIGKSPDYIISKTMKPYHSGTKEHGVEFVQWKIGKLIIEAWFKNEACTCIDFYLPKWLTDTAP
ncbi:hypothetical protein [Xenorhabdus innexi]|uniref:Uncharacterized protein n=1 Tax=Xenorhabdus innexi TaxID=290109 RepID=A0A1N6N1Z1_9GAMM|nr:hypothetical protein [Xenorhabdus innexi]PHM37177.1 hypothetical protein Xinn_01144 [Xenorhabdus innexi]SIP75042.1 conserved hypothetical protein [Xenorhabdus innexi]